MHCRCMDGCKGRCPPSRVVTVLAVDRWRLGFPSFRDMQVDLATGKTISEQVCRVGDQHSMHVGPWTCMLGGRSVGGQLLRTSPSLTWNLVTEC